MTKLVALEPTLELDLGFGEMDTVALPLGRGG